MTQNTTVNIQHLSKVFCVPDTMGSISHSLTQVLPLYPFYQPGNQSLESNLPEVTQQVNNSAGLLTPHSDFRSFCLKHCNIIRIMKYNLSMSKVNSLHNNWFHLYLSSWSLIWLEKELIFSSYQCWVLNQLVLSPVQKVYVAMVCHLGDSQTSINTFLFKCLAKLSFSVGSHIT